jgi:hypothetical protein
MFSCERFPSLSVLVLLMDDVGAVMSAPPPRNGDHDTDAPFGFFTLADEGVVDASTGDLRVDGSGV